MYTCRARLTPANEGVQLVSGEQEEDIESRRAGQAGEISGKQEEDRDLLASNCTQADQQTTGGFVLCN